VSTEAPGSMTKLLSVTFLPPPVSESPLPSWSIEPWTYGLTEPGL